MSLFSTPKLHRISTVSQLQQPSAEEKGTPSDFSFDGSWSDSSALVISKPANWRVSTSYFPRSLSSGSFNSDTEAQLVAELQGKHSKL